MSNKTIIYIRTSTEEQTPELQLKDCEALAQKLELKEYEVIPDKQSAWKDNVEREGFEKLKKEIEQGKIKNLLCWDLDRLYRNRKKLIAFFQLCKVYGCKIYSARQEWLEGLNKIQEPFNEIMFDLMLSIMGWLAEDESTKKSMRVKNAVVRKDKQGNLIKAISYKGKKWGRKALSHNVITQVLELHKQGLSIRNIAKQVFYNDKNNNKKQVSIAVVHKIITENKQAQELVSEPVNHLGN